MLFIKWSYCCFFILGFSDKRSFPVSLSSMVTCLKSVIRFLGQGSTRSSGLHQVQVMLIVTNLCLRTSSLSELASGTSHQREQHWAESLFVQLPTSSTCTVLGIYSKRRAGKLRYKWRSLGESNLSFSFDM